MKFLLFFLIVLSFYCKPHPVIKNTPSFKDSIVRQYLSFVDSATPYDSNNSAYKILKAYMNDDSSFFNKMSRRMTREYHFYKAWAAWDSCVKFPRLSDMAIDEGYRFIHRQSFCPYGQKITITRKGSIVKLNYVEFSNGEGHTFTLQEKDGSRVEVKPYCVVTKQFDKILSIKEWRELENRLFNADYWGLIPEIPFLSTDGSSWTVEGFEDHFKYATGQQIYSVLRQCGCNPAFEAIGRYFLLLSGEKTMCKEFF